MIVNRARETARGEIDTRLSGGDVELQRELVDRTLRKSMERIGF